MSGYWVVPAAYFLGAIPFGLLLGKLTRGIDVRQEGSGNIGATNVARALGMGAGVLTLLLDLGKGAAAVEMGRVVLGPEGWPALTGFAALLGHIFPVFLYFRGGKGVATGFGVFLVLDAVATLLAGALFLVVVVTTRRVSAGSVLAAILLPVLLVVRHAPLPVVTVSLLSSILIVVRHRENIRKILAGTEPGFGGGKKSG